MTEPRQQQKQGWSVRLYRGHGFTMTLRGPAGFYFRPRRRVTGGTVHPVQLHGDLAAEIGIASPPEPRVVRKGWTLSLGHLVVAYAK